MENIFFEYQNKIVNDIHKNVSEMYSQIMTLKLMYVIPYEI